MVLLINKIDWFLYICLLFKFYNLVCLLFKFYKLISSYNRSCKVILLKLSSKASCAFRRWLVKSPSILPPSGQALGESEWILKSFSLSFTALKI